MATKKQKREAARAKREQFMKEEREHNLRMLKADRSQRQEQEMRDKVEELNENYEERLRVRQMFDHLID